MSGQRLYQQVVDKILELIDTGEFPVDSRLPPERELSERFGVSRPTIREAVIALEAKNRVAVKVGSGMYVTKSKSAKKIGGGVSPFELMEARVLIEGEAAALAASMITPEQLSKLETALRDMEEENMEDELGEDNADRRFHRIIAEATNNRVLALQIENLWTAQEDIHHIKTAHQSICLDDPQTRLNEHRAIYEALLKGDSQEARLAMRRHFTRAIDALHHATEEEAVEQVRRKLSQTRERFSVDRLMDPVQNGLGLD